MDVPDNIDVFIGYASEDEALAAGLAAALEDRWSVWWDRHIPAGIAYDEFIDRVLATTRCAIILWSPRSVKKEWVRTEAAEAKRRRILIPVVIDTVRPPLQFRLDQTRDLAGWTGETSDPRFQRLLRDIELLTAGHPAPGTTTGGPGRDGLDVSPSAGHSPLIRMLERNRSVLVAIGPALLTGMTLWIAHPSFTIVLAIFFGFGLLQFASLALALVAFFASGGFAAIAARVLDFFYGEMFTDDRGKVLAQVMAVGLILQLLLYAGFTGS